MKKILVSFLLSFAWLIGQAQTFPVQNLQVNGTSLLTGALTANGGMTLTNGFTATGLVTTTDLAVQAANTILANATGSSASPTAITVTGCNGAAQALQWTNGTGFGCNSSLATSGANANITSLSGLTTALSVPQGGTGATNFGTHGVLLGEGVGAIGNTATGTSGYVLTSNGASSDPSFSSTVAGLTFTGPISIGGATYYPTVPTNSALQALSTATTSTVTRLGYSVSGDAPPLVYTASGSACSLNSGNGDNGSQVKSADSKCWIADFPSHVMDVREYGAKCDGSTDDTTPITNVVANALTSPNSISITGTCKVSSSIPSLHSQAIVWIGNGAIKNGTNPTFYLNPPAGAANANTVYLSPSGSDTNDGLSPSTPIQTLNHFFSIVGRYNPAGVCSNWVATLAAGTYAGATVPYGMTTCAPGSATLSLSDGHIQINGPQPSGSLGQQVQPTAIINSSAGPGGQTFGLGIDGKSSIQITNVYFQNWSLECIYANPMTDLVLINVWFAGCTDFAVDARMSHVYVVGGTIDGSTSTSANGIQTGLSFLNETMFTVTSIDNTNTNGTLMKNMSVSGMQYIENATGHIDYATIQNSVIGIEGAEASHAQLDNDSVTGNTTAWLEKDASSSYLANSITNSGNGNSNATLPISVQTIPWSPYSVSVGCASGTITSYTVTGTYTKLANNVINFQADLAVTTLGTCSGQVHLTVPVTAGQYSVANGDEISLSGATWGGVILNGSTIMNLYRYDGSTGLASGGNYVFNGSYESQ